MRHLSDLVVNSNGFVFEPSLGEGFMLNDSGLLLLEMFRSGANIKDASERLSQVFGVSLGQAYTDAFDFLGKLKILGFEVSA